MVARIFPKDAVEEFGQEAPVSPVSFRREGDKRGSIRFTRRKFNRPARDRFGLVEACLMGLVKSFEKQQKEHEKRTNACPDHGPLATA
ncbi:MAG TPA: hypothetical protein VKE70_39235, partial [Candidatus Solibacter sp.]|nr:hypothetical protein [Candidatus Solibacter sp.]